MIAAMFSAAPRTCGDGPSAPDAEAVVTLDECCASDGIWLRDGEDPVSVFLYFSGAGASSKRVGLYLIAARAAGVMAPGFVDLLHGGDLVTEARGPAPETALRYFEAEAAAMLAMRRAT